MTLHHLDSVAASAVGVVTGVAVATQVPDPNLVDYLPTLIGPLLVLVANRAMSAFAARRRVKAKVLKEAALDKLTDSDPENDAEGRQEALEAAQLEAEADAWEGKSK